MQTTMCRVSQLMKLIVNGFVKYFNQENLLGFGQEMFGPVEPLSIEKGAPARKSGTQSLSLSRAKHASQQAVSSSFHMPSCLHVFFCVAHSLHSNRGARGPPLGVCSLGGARIPLRTGGFCNRGEGIWGSGGAHRSTSAQRILVY